MFGLNNYMSLLQQQADDEERKRQEAAFRAQVPVGPPTQVQAQHLNQPTPYTGVPYTHQPAWNPPYKPPEFAVPKPQPFPQVTKPVVSTQAPPIQSSQVQASTLPSAVQAPIPQVQPSAPKPFV